MRERRNSAAGASYDSAASLKHLLPYSPQLAQLLIKALTGQQQRLPLNSKCVNFVANTTIEAEPFPPR